MHITKGPKEIVMKSYRVKSLLMFTGGVLMALGAVMATRADYSNTVMSLNPVGYWRLNEPATLPTTVTNYGSLGAVANGSYYGWGSAWDLSPHGVPGALAGDPNTATIFYEYAKGRGRILIPWNAAINPDPPQPFTVECWANSTGIDTGTLVHSMLAGDNPANERDRSGWSFRAEGTDLKFVIGSTDYSVTPYKFITAAGVVQIGTWQHFAAVYDGTSVILYADGVEVAREVLTTPLLANYASQTAIGGRGEKYDGWNFSGYIDEVAIYNKALSSADILAHYQNGTNANRAIPYNELVLSQNPIVYYRMDEWPVDPPPPVTAVNSGSWGAGADGIYMPGANGGAQGVPYKGFGTNNTGCVFAGTAGLRDGTPGNPDTPGSCIKVPPQNGTTENMTITCWIKRDGDQWVWRGLVTQRDSDESSPNGAGNGTGLTLGANGSSPNVGQELRILWNKGDVYWQWDPGLNTPHQQWAFCAVVFTPTNRTVYLNTRAVSRIVPESETTMPSGPHDWSVNPIFIGYDARGPYYGENSAFKGVMDEVAIFDRALTADEIMQLYAAAEVPPIILVQPQAPPPPVYEGTSLSLSVKCDESASASPLHYQWTKNGVAMPGQTAPELVFNNLTIGDSGNYAVVVNNTFGAVTSSIVALTVVSGPPVIVKAPEPVSRYAGARATFTVTAVGSGPLSYQWNLNGVPITGATSPVYTLSDLGPGDVGTYSVLVSNPYGSTNVSATLTLLTPSKLATAIIERNPIGYWRMDETIGTVAYDSWGERNGTYGAGITNNVPGPEPPALKGFDPGNKAYAFDGSRGYVDVPAFGQIAGSMTIIAWIKPDAVQVDYTGLVFTRGGGGTVCGLDYTRGSQLGYTWNDAPQSYNWDSGLYPTPDRWNFVALVVEPTQATLYLDDGSGLWSSVNYLNHGTATWNAVRFGHDTGGPGARYFKGSMDDVAVYDHALTESEIKIIRDAGVDGTLVVTPVAIVEQPKGQTIMAGNSYVLQAKVVGTPPLAFQWKKNGQDIPGAVRSSLVFDSATESDTGTYQLFVTQGTTTISTTPVTLTVKPVPSYVDLSEGLVLHLKFDGDYKDSSGRNNNGEPRGVPEIVSGKIGSGALQYSTLVESGAVTAANYVSLGTPADLDFGPGQSFSVAFWIKFTGSPGDLPFIANNGYSMGDKGVTIAPSYNQGGWSWGLNDAIEPRPWPGIGLYDPVRNTLNDGNWHHLVHVFDRAGDGTTWLDGVKVHAMSIATAHDWDLRTGMEWCVGQAGGSYAEPGVFTIDDIGIWRRVLTDYDAQAIYVVGQRGLSFDTTAPPEVTLRVKKVGSDIVIEWSTGTLEYADNVQGPWSSVPDAIAPSVTVAPSSTARFYRVKVQ